MVCCENFKLNLEDEDIPLQYFVKFREYGIQVADGSTAIVQIHHCPWCGAQLPSGLRDRWFDEIEGRGLNVDSANIPEDFKSDAWWKKLGI